MSDGCADSNHDPKPCTNGCGFFGSPSTNGMCSKCYKETTAKTATSTSSPLRRAREEAKHPDPSTLTPTKTPTAAASSTPATSTPATASDSEETPSRKVQKKRNRCWNCKKRVGFTGIECRCGYVFCGKCRYPNEHGCDFDFQTAERDVLKHNAVAATFAKLERV